MYLFACGPAGHQLERCCDANNYLCAKFIQTVTITCAMQEVMLLSAYILHAAYVAFDTLFPSFNIL